MTEASGRAQVQFVSKSRYLTARCPSGCESWLHPRAVKSHLRPGRCRGEAWVDALDDSALVPQPDAAMFIGRLPAELVGPVAMSEERGRYPRPEGFRYDVIHGIVVRSPIDGVRARRWVYVVTAALDQFGPGAIDRALTSAGFEELGHRLNLDETLVDCPICGETVKQSRINLHRARSTLCRWRRAQGEVRSLWETGWRDPFSVPDAPTTWTELQARAAWRRRTRTVEFPRWVAVLLSPIQLPR